ncbi:MAG: hypothetical protein HC884_19895, partial [Chloroflexaceae bacterium]|nr:hypothetical protein [Chloroflexaceae bacterium]
MPMEEHQPQSGSGWGKVSGLVWSLLVMGVLLLLVTGCGGGETPPPPPPPPTAPQAPGGSLEPGEGFP